MMEAVEKKFECSVCGQKYYSGDMVLILDGEAVCRFCNQEGKK